MQKAKEWVGSSFPRSDRGPVASKIPLRFRRVWWKIRISSSFQRQSYDWPPRMNLKDMDISEDKLREDYRAVAESR
jgi:hypothetical protein